VKQLLIPLIFLSCVACHEQEERSAGISVASAYEEKLYRSDLRGVIPVNSSHEDSVALAHSFINNWLTDKAVLANAKETLQEQELDIEEKIEDYRNSLLIYSFERKWVQQKLDTSLSRDSVQSYYEKNAGKFKLKEDVVKLRWFVLTSNDAKGKNKKLLKLLKSAEPVEQSELEKILAGLGTNLKDYDGAWVRWNRVEQELPLVESDLNRSESQRTWFVQQDDLMYFVQLKAQRARAAEAPVELVEDEIAAILLNQKKAQLLEQMRKDLFAEAQKNGYLTIDE